MQSVEELHYLVKMGSVTEREANVVLRNIVGQIQSNKNELEGRFGLSKQAGAFDSAWPMLLSGILGSVALTGIGVGTHYLTEHLEERKQEKKMDESFELMKKVNPDIKDIPLVQQRQSFSVLKAVSPTIARNPVLAANFIQRQATNYGGAGFEEAANLARAEAAMAPRNPGVGQQISGQLIQQGIGSMAGHMGTFTRKGIEEGFEDPIRIGEGRGIAAYEEQKALDKLTGQTTSEREEGLALAKERGKQVGRELGVTIGVMKAKDSDAYMQAARIRGQAKLNEDIGKALTFSTTRTEKPEAYKDLLHYELKSDIAKKQLGGLDPTGKKYKG